MRSVVGLGIAIRIDRICQRLGEHRPREDRPDERTEPRQEHQREDRRDDDVGEDEAETLMVDDLLAEGLTFLGVRNGVVESGLRNTDSDSGDAGYACDRRCDSTTCMMSPSVM